MVDRKKVLDRAERAQFINQGAEQYKALRPELERLYPGKRIAISVKTGRWCLTEDDDVFVAFAALLPHDDFLWMTEIDSAGKQKYFAELERHAKAHKKSWLTRLTSRIQYHWLKFRNRPLQFKWVEEGEGEPVGEPVEVCHLTFYDMMEHQACGILTGKVLLEGMRINALRRVSFERLDHSHGKTTLQPYWI